MFRNQTTGVPMIKTEPLGYTSVTHEGKGNFAGIYRLGVPFAAIPTEIRDVAQKYFGILSTGFNEDALLTRIPVKFYKRGEDFATSEQVGAAMVKLERSMPNSVMRISKVYAYLNLEPIGAVELALGEKNHPVVVYRMGVAPESVKRLHENWPKEYFGVLMRPWDEGGEEPENEIRIFEVGYPISCGNAPVKISGTYGSYKIEYAD